MNVIIHWNSMSFVASLRRIEVNESNGEKSSAVGRETAMELRIR